jgi:hypothetical protein
MPPKETAKRKASLDGVWGNWGIEITYLLGKVSYAEAKAGWHDAKAFPNWWIWNGGGWQAKVGTT